jgi:hypothetical protein
VVYQELHMGFIPDLVISVAVECCRWRRKPSAKLMARIVGSVLHVPGKALV